MPDPRHVLDAPSHAQPYGWYAELRRARPVFFDEHLQLWVLSGAQAVRAALAHPLLRVRPPAEPVPRALQGTAAGEVFARLVRMNDGAFHARHRPEVTAAAERFGPAQVEAAAHAATSDLAGRVSPDAFLSALPGQAMARLLGVPDAELQRTVDGVRAFVRGIGPGADAQAVAQASEAALTLMAQGEAQGLPPVAAANRIAFMQQALDATAGLVGNALAALRSGEASLEGTAFVERVAREDPAVHNTRRFAAQDLELAGARIGAGQGVVLVLVDGDQGALPFGDGAHACPGERIALHLAAATLRTLRALDALPRFAPVMGYRPLPNARIPLFTLGANAWSP